MELNGNKFPRKRNVLIVYAHHTKTSFNAALLDTAVTTLQEQGCDVTVSDLYGMKFNPIIGRDSIKGKCEVPFQYTPATAKAYKEGRLQDDVNVEQEKIRKADLIIFQFPIQWSSLPAILKGWIERVFIMGFCTPGNRHEAPIGYDDSYLVGKKVVLSVTINSTREYYSPDGRHGDIEVVLYPIQTCILQANGLSVLRPQLNFSINLISDKERKVYLKNWKQRLYTIWDEEPLHSIPNSEFDENDILKANSKYRKSEIAPSVGIHLGKPLAKDGYCKLKNNL